MIFFKHAIKIAILTYKLLFSIYLFSLPLLFHIQSFRNYLFEIIFIVVFIIELIVSYYLCMLFSVKRAILTCLIDVLLFLIACFAQIFLLCWCSLSQM
jgi:hypothetical protein